jgi:Nickel responsive protein SCO4226-like
MAHGQRQGPRQTFLIEHYRPGRDVAQLASSIARLRKTVAEMERAGVPVHYLSSTIVPRDESFLCLIEAPSEGVVADVYGRAEVPFERISAAICVED